MEGNTSNGEEEDFIFALKNEMPEVLQNLENTEKIVKESEDLVLEVKKTLNIEKMNEL